MSVENLVSLTDRIDEHFKKLDEVGVTKTHQMQIVSVIQQADSTLESLPLRGLLRAGILLAQVAANQTNPRQQWIATQLAVKNLFNALTAKDKTPQQFFDQMRDSKFRAIAENHHFINIVRDQTGITLDTSPIPNQKWPKNMRSTKFPAYVIVKEKHGSYVFLIKNFKDLEKLALKLLTERCAAGYWYSRNDIPATFEEYFQSRFNITAEEAAIFAKMPKHSINGYDSTTLVGETKRYYQQLVDENQEYDEMVKAIKDKNGVFAWSFLSSRRGEYEHVSLEPFYSL